jgi:hypothetical protein
MKIFEVIINNRVETVHATKARIAINKAMTFYPESHFTPCVVVKARAVGLIKYTYIVKATQRESLTTMFRRVDGLGPYKTKKEAQEAADTINATARDMVNPTTFSARVYRMDQQGRVTR